MNSLALFAVTTISKRHLAIIAATMVVIMSMPIIAVFSLGQGLLSFLSGSPADSSTTNAISTTTVGLYEGPPVEGDTYAWGNCTYWAYALRLKAGNPIPTTWGNAATWAPRAQQDGYAVDHTPSPGAVMQTPDSAGGLGHVAYVTAIDSVTGAWTISEMNVKGLDVVDITTYPATASIKFNFIHNKGVAP